LAGIRFSEGDHDPTRPRPNDYGGITVQENTSGSRRAIVVSQPFAAFYEQTHIPAARKAGNRLLLTGHTGENPDGSYSDDVRAQLRQTFRNVEATLREAGAGWTDIVSLNSYHVGLQAQADALLEIAAEFLAEPYPAWTAVGVTELIDPGAVVEISCEAILPDGS
jgi:enamine deaminase RidA (YjgF/YER057c/UK114 family)